MSVELGVAEAAAADPDVAALLEDLASGKIAPSTPIPGVTDAPWPLEAVERLDAVLDQLCRSPTAVAHQETDPGAAT